MPERVIDVAPACVPDELGWSEEAPMADTHYSHLLPFLVLVQETFDPLPVGAVPSCRHARHLLHRAHPAALPLHLFQCAVIVCIWSVVGQRGALVV